MAWSETKTDRTLVVSLMLGPPGPLLKALDYAAWLDRAGWLDEAEAAGEQAPTAECVHCGKPFYSLRSTAKYCSRACEGRAHRRRAA